MPQGNFKNKIRDLSPEEFEQTEDFFSQAQSLNEGFEETTTNNTKLYTTNTPPSQRLTNADEIWIDASSEGYEGQLAVDVYQDEKNLYMQAIVGGIKPEDIEVHLNNDMLTIKGKRVQPHTNIHPEQYYIQECYWGGFSRSIILPVDIQNESVEATTANGVLTIILPKSNRPRHSRIQIKEVK